MSTYPIKRDFRAEAGRWGVKASVALFALVLILFALLEGAFHTWVIGKYFENRASVFVDAFLLLAGLSILTLLLSLWARGRSRLIGVVVIALTIIMVILIFGTTA